jgi:hypothetical protein
MRVAGAAWTPCGNAVCAAVAACRGQALDGHGMQHSSEAERDRAIDPGIVAQLRALGIGSAAREQARTTGSDAEGKLVRVHDGPG